MQAYMMTGQAKIAGVADFLDSLIESNTKFLLLCRDDPVSIGVLYWIEVRIRSVKLPY